MSLYVLVGYIVVDHVGKVIFLSVMSFLVNTAHTNQANMYLKNILSFWSSRVLINKDIFCKGITVLVRHH